ncbi:protein disulfide-isomerase [Phyllopteryx taeniolatus]|uniref:protein disulfide-isomerase n=1 Tax=Phyllopteryx taeniolatus TaxID=161469 RepID=UPI002AD3D8CF|nr:protein disulfide-isomerase [Phyllopteryx taeniolatus]
MARPLLLLLMLVASSCLAASGQEVKMKEGILQLHKGNFNRALRTYERLLVLFYAPLSADGHRLSEVFQGAAVDLQDSDVKLATVDVTKDKALAKELNTTGLSNIRLYLLGDKFNFVSCPVPQSSASVVTWLKRRAGTVTDLVADLSQWGSEEEEFRVAGFFEELDSKYAQVFYAAAVSLPDVNFAVTQNDDVISKYDVAKDVVLLFKQSKLIQAYKMTPQTSKEDLLTFVSVYQMDPVTEYSGKTATQILSSPVLSHALLFVNKSSADFHEAHAAFSAAAEAFRMKILFVLVDVFEPRNGRLMEYFRVRAFEAPLVRLVNMVDHVTYQLPSMAPDAGAIEAFCLDYLEGKAKPKMQSEPIPDGWDRRPVKELVGSTFEEVAFNPNRTVFVLFYVPYSPESRVVFPLWEELAEAFKDRDDIAVARIDASANDIDMSVQRAYPAFCLFPALYAERAVFYTGEMKPKALLAFVHEEMKKAAKDRMKEDEDRRKYVEVVKAEEEEKKERNTTKDEL